MGKNNVIIVVPMYKSDLNALETISLQQLFRILGKNYTICFMVPNTLQIAEVTFPVKLERFDDAFFQSTETYSKLLLSDEFYQRFLAYDFLLIYQLDAFVFSDQLREFCSLNYDYIGAPVPRICWRFLKKRIGNGGFSLRKISSILRLLTQKEKILLKAQYDLPHSLFSRLLLVEDLFFAYCSTLPELNFITPSIEVAKQFSIEYDVAHAYKWMQDQLPFGCHRWYSDNFDTWGPIVKKYGYIMSNETKTVFTCSGLYQQFRIDCLRKYLYKRIIQANNKQRLETAFHGVLALDEVYSIWGYGEIGHDCLLLLRMGDLRLVSIYDKQAGGGTKDGTVPILPPDDALLQLRKSKVIIATTKYEAEIQQHLQELGFVKNKDYYIFADVLCALVIRYYAKCKCISGDKI
jgi:hypothetical protein